MASEIRRLALILAAAACLATPAAAELAKWDQARVTGIAQQLATACDGFWQAVQRQPGRVDWLRRAPGTSSACRTKRAR